MPNSSTVLVIRSDYEEATHYLSAYMQKIVDFANQRGFTVIDLLGYDATQTKFMEALETNDPLLVVAAGHGNETLFTAQNGETVLKACENDQVMSGREGFFSSCSVGVQLGPSMLDKTAKLFAGWRADFLFLLEDPPPSNLLDDVYAKPFMECIIQPALTRLQGRNASAIYNDTINLFNYHINDWWESDDPYAQDVISLLIHDRDNFMVSGVTPMLAGLGTAPILIVGALIAGHYLFGFP